MLITSLSTNQILYIWAHGWGLYRLMHTKVWIKKLIHSFSQNYSHEIEESDTDDSIPVLNRVIQWGSELQAIGFTACSIMDDSPVVPNVHSPHSHALHLIWDTSKLVLLLHRVGYRGREPKKRHLTATHSIANFLYPPVYFIQIIVDRESDWLKVTWQH